jgi:cellulose synthase/poly-beta-1,6-N-acetylglucosamine synthase-like glycosyltransferase
VRVAEDSATVEHVIAERGTATVRSEQVLVGWRQAVYLLLTLWLFASIAVFAGYWVHVPDKGAHPVLFAAASIGIAYLIGVWIGPWLSLPRMQRPVFMPAQPGLRVAVVTTFAPNDESLDLLEQSLAALVALEYPHDTWVLDEGDSAAVRALCARLGARHFSRRGRPEYQAEHGPLAARTKFGNLNAWLAEPESQQYDVLASFDPDHIPERTYLTRTLGYFADAKVGYVQAPQFFYNQEASFIARGAAEESYEFYSSLQMANHAFGEPAITGSHVVYRLAALRALGGFPPHDAEDLYVTLLYSASPWRGVYVPEVLAMGTTPVDWRGYLRQQRRWARALIDLKLRVFPRLARRMTFMERLVGLLHGANYQRPLVLLLWYPMLLYMLLANVQPSFYHRYVTYAGFMLTMVFWVADRFRQTYYLDRPREEGVHWRSLVLQYAKWPYFAQALWEALRRWQGDFDVTRKKDTVNARGSVALPHLALAAVMSAALAVRVVLHGIPRPALLWSAIGFVAFSLLLACTEALRYPPQFERGRHARRRALLADRLGAP